MEYWLLTHASVCYPFIKYSTNRKASRSEFSTNIDVRMNIYINKYKYVPVSGTIEQPVNKMFGKLRFRQIST